VKFFNQNYFYQNSEMKNLCYDKIHLFLFIKELSGHSLFFFWPGIFIRSLKIRGEISVLKKLYLYKVFYLPVFHTFATSLT